MYNKIMQTLILPGYSASNKDWVDEVTKTLKVEGIIRPFIGCIGQMRIVNLMYKKRQN